jgi:hypothetical protein
VSTVLGTDRCAMYSQGISVLHPGGRHAANDTTHVGPCPSPNASRALTGSGCCQSPRRSCPSAGGTPGPGFGRLGQLLDGLARSLRGARGRLHAHARGVAERVPGVPAPVRRCCHRYGVLSPQPSCHRRKRHGRSRRRTTRTFAEVGYRSLARVRETQADGRRAASSDPCRRSMYSSKVQQRQHTQPHESFP